MKRHGGFTLMELVITMLIVSIVATVALPKLSNISAFGDAGFSDKALFAVSYAQKLAVAARNPVYVTLGASNVRVCYDAGCASLVADPGNGLSLNLTAPTTAGFSFSGGAASFSFDAQGVPNFATRLTVNAGGRSFNVEPATGLIWQ